MLRLLKITLVALCSFILPAAADNAARGPILVTVSGALTNPSRGPVNPDFDKFFDYNEVEFSQAASFDYAALASLTQARITTDFPQFGDQHEFEGPYLADLLQLAGATGGTIWLRALDGYALELPLAALLAQEPILAMKRDGQFFGLGDYGPLQLVFARGTNPALTDLDDSTWIYSIYHIHVE